MHVAHLTLHNFRSYADLDVELEPGATAFIGRNGQGKTNLVEAIDYLSRLSSHRVASDAPLVKAGADQALIRAAVVRSAPPVRVEPLERLVGAPRGQPGRPAGHRAEPGHRLDRQLLQAVQVADPERLGHLLAERGKGGAGVLRPSGASSGAVRPSPTSAGK